MVARAVVDESIPAMARELETGDAGDHGVTVARLFRPATNDELHAKIHTPMSMNVHSPALQRDS